MDKVLFQFPKPQKDVFINKGKNKTLELRT